MSLSNPLIVLGLGQMGMRIAADLDDTASALTSPLPSAHAVIGTLGDDPVQVRMAFLSATNRLMEAGAGAQTTARLDIAIVADLSSLDALVLVQAIRVVTDALRDEFPVLFPPDSSPDQRSIWLTVYAGTPPLVATPAGVAFAETLRALEALRPTLRHPALSRVFLVPRQTTVGRLDDEGLEHALRAALQTIYLSGWRDEDRVRSALCHRVDGRHVASLAVATADLPIARIRRYARWRLALSGLQTLLEQAELPTTDPNRTEALRQQLDPLALLDDFVAGEPAQRVRARAARISGAEDHLPERWKVSLMQRPLEIRAQYRVLFEPIAKPWSRRIDPTNDPDHHTMLRMVDKVEADILRAVDHKLTALLDEQLEPSTALRILPSLEHALKVAKHTLDEELAGEIVPLPSPEPPPPPTDPGLLELEHVIDGRPGFRATWNVWMALTGGVLASVVVVATTLMGPEAAVGTASTPLPPTLLETWAVGFLVALLTAGAWQLLVLWSWRTDARAALERRTHELAAAWRQGGAGQEREQADRLLAVRRRRTAHDLQRRLGAAAERLAALRAAIRQSTNTAAGALADLRVRLGPTPGHDDLHGLLGLQSPLHSSLITAPELAERLEGIGAHKDLQRWAGQILTETWPRMGGLSEDLPCVDLDAILQACDHAIGVLPLQTLLGDERTTSTRAREFLRQGVPALAWGLQPVDAHGDPVRGSGQTHRHLVAPARLRAGVEAGLADSPMQLTPSWTGASVPWLSLIALWDGLQTEDVVRGMGVRT